MESNQVASNFQEHRVSQFDFFNVEKQRLEKFATWANQSRILGKDECHELIWSLKTSRHNSSKFFIGDYDELYPFFLNAKDSDDCYWCFLIKNGDYKTQTEIHKSRFAFIFDLRDPHVLKDLNSIIYQQLIFEGKSHFASSHRFIDKIKDQCLEECNGSAKSREAFLSQSMESYLRHSSYLFENILTLESEDELTISFVDYILKEIQPGSLHILERVSFENNFEFLETFHDHLLKGNIVIPLSTNLKWDDFQKSLNEKVSKRKDQFFIISQNALSKHKHIFCTFLDHYFTKKSTFEKNNKIIQNENFWKRTFETFPMPLGVFNEYGDITIHNKLFLGLGLSPRECKNLEDLSTVELKNTIYKVYKTDSEVNSNRLTFFLFYPTGQDFFKSLDTPGTDALVRENSTRELGIITSSLAHEINNPLAAILALIQVLLLDDYPESVMSTLREMETSSKRCKSLVEIFLGFSRAQISPNNKQSIQQALNKSLELLRFRMIEMNINIEMNIDISVNKFQRTNISILTMFYYLLLGDILTYISKLSLLRDGYSSNILKGKFFYKDESVVLSFEKKYNFKTPSDSKLLEHLLNLDNLTFRFEDDEFFIAPLS
jgi:hypothetical protein